MNVPPQKRLSREKSEKGQISIMVGVMMTTFILFFAFVVNTGMLVNAKINLQNAADLAAFAGASVQARQLNQISYLNYEMRRQWKKLLFRLYVLGNMSQDAFQDAQGGTGMMSYYPNRSNPGADYSVPSTCITFNSNDNFCHITQLPKISIPPETFMDSVSDTLRSQLQAIEKIRQNNCKGIGLTNLMVNLYWLYNTDPEMKNFGSGSGMTAEQINTLKIVQGLTTGLGIVPRELLLKYRIDTLTKYVNAPVQKNLTKGGTDGFSSSPDPSSFERSIQAFYSAYYTLGNHSFPSDSIVMDELIPGDSNSANLLVLKPIFQSFDTYAIDPIVDTVASDGSGNCLAMINPISVTQKLPVGVAKNPSILTFYAIRLKAKARVLFSPFGDLELKAYAAAQPFGSRIGPDLPENAFAMPGSPSQLNSSNFANTTVPTTVNFTPNLPVKTTDSITPSKTTGWNTKEMMSAMYATLRVNGGGSNVIDTSAIENAYATAMAPNPWEATRYNIMNDAGVDYFVRNFGQDRMAAFWAPIFPPGKSSQQISDQLRSDIQNLFSTNAAGGSGGVTSSGNAAVARVQDSVLNGLTLYMGTLREGRGEQSEGMNIVRISNPFLRKDGTPISGDPTLFLSVADASVFKSSWNGVNDGEIRQAGRVGYSVKFVSFDSLTSHKLTTNGSASWNNGLGGDSEADGDIPLLKH